MESGTTESARSIEILAWLEVNKIKVAIGAAAVAALIAIYFLMNWQAAQRSIAANASLFALAKPRGAEGVKPPVDPEAYLRVASEYPGTEAAGRALLLAAGAYYTDGDFGKAETAFEAFLREYGDGPFAAVAGFGIAACRDARGMAGDAIISYQDVFTRYPDSAVVPQARLAVGRLYEGQGDFEEALDSYKTVAALSSQSAWSGEASRRQAELLAGHPELVKEAPAAPPSTNALNPLIEPVILPGREPE